MRLVNFPLAWSFTQCFAAGSEPFMELSRLVERDKGCLI
jgi:hypothetical protein